MPARALAPPGRRGPASAPRARDVGQRRDQLRQLALAGDAELGVDVPDMPLDGGPAASCPGRDVVDGPGGGREQRRWRVSAEPGARPWREASGGGAKRRAAMCSGTEPGRAAGDGSGATEPRRRKDAVLPYASASEARSERSERRRQGSSPEGRRPRQRAPWSRAGRSRARRNRARRPVVRPGGRPYLRPGRAVDIEPSSAMIGYDPDAERIEDLPNRAASGGLVAASDAVHGRREFGHIAVALRSGVGFWRRGPASVRRRRDSAEPDARPGRGVRGAVAAPGARAARARSAAPRSATLCTAQKERPIPRRSEGPALAGGRCAAVTRRRAGPGCRAGGPCRPGSR